MLKPHSPNVPHTHLLHPPLRIQIKHHSLPFPRHRRHLPTLMKLSFHQALPIPQLRIERQNLLLQTNHLHHHGPMFLRPLNGPAETSRQRSPTRQSRYGDGARSPCSEDSPYYLGTPRLPSRLAALPAETARLGAPGLGG